MKFPNEHEKQVLKSFIPNKFTLMRVSHEKINRFYTDLWFLKSKYGVRYLIPPKTVAPSFFLCGFPRSGTTSMYNYLNSHPNIQGSQEKEPKFFSHEYARGMKYYSLQFPKVKQNLTTFDASQSYLYNPFAMNRIKKEFPNSKFIVCMRKPVEQVISMYSLQKKNGREICSFEECIDQEIDRVKLFVKRHKSDYVNPWASGISIPYLYVATYINHIKHALTLFKQKQFLFISSEELFNNTQNVVSKCFQFLNLPDYKINPLVYRSVKHENMDDELIKDLQSYFRPYNSELQNLTGINLNE